MSDHVIRAAKFAALLAIAILVAVAVGVGSALLGHEILVLAVGVEGIPAIDDTLPMFVIVAGTYLAATAAGLLVLVAGWRRFLRRPEVAGARRGWD